MRFVMEFIIISIVAFLISLLTMFSGFGLGTILMPTFALFFPIEIAIASTAIVHGANNIFKVILLGKYANKKIILKFGIPALIFAIFGASLLSYLSYFKEIYTYNIASKQAIITPIKLSMAILMLVFAFFELLPKFKNLKFKDKYLFLGGILSGFFGGFSGHQGALRSAFLAKVNIAPQNFVGTNAVIGFMVDMVRIGTYFALFLGIKNNNISKDLWILIILASICAFTGVIVGKKYLKKVTMSLIQNLTGILLILIALLLGTGLI